MKTSTFSILFSNKNNMGVSCEKKHITNLPRPGVTIFMGIFDDVCTQKQKVQINFHQKKNRFETTSCMTKTLTKQI